MAKRPRVLVVTKGHPFEAEPFGIPLGTWGVAKRRPANESVFSERWGEPVTWTVDEPLWPPTTHGT